MIKKQTKMVVYKVTNIINGKIYIGKTIRGLEARKKSHLDSSIKGDKAHFHCSIRKYGSNNFIWKVIKYCDNECELNKMEIAFIKKYKRAGYHLYNHTNGGDGSSGYKHTKRSLNKISIKSKIKWNDKEYREKQRKSHEGKYGLTKGYKHSEETKKKISFIQKGKKRGPHTKETIEKMRLSKLGANNPMYGKLGKNNPKYGVKISDETRLRLSISHIGQKAWNKGIPSTEATKKKISESKKGTILSNETKEKISKSNLGKHNYWKGKTVSKETKDKISKALKGRKLTKEHKDKIKNNWHKYHSRKII